MKNSKIVKKTILFSKFGKIFTKKKLKMSDGRFLDWYYLDTPRSVIIIPLTVSGKLVLIKQYRYNLKKYVYELPAGTADFGGLNYLQNAKIELLEETGYEPQKLIDLGKYYNLPSETNRWTKIFLAENCVRVGKPKHDNIIEKYFDMSIVLKNFDDVTGSIGKKGSIIESIEHSFALILAKKYLQGINPNKNINS